MGAGPVFPVSVFYPPAPGEGVQSRFCRWGAFFVLKWGAFFLVFLSFSIWFSTLKNPRGLFFLGGVLCMDAMAVIEAALCRLWRRCSRLSRRLGLG